MDLYNSGLQDQIDALQKISNKWSEINEKIVQGQNEEVASSILDSGWKDKVLSGNDSDIFNMFSGMYQNTANQLKQYESQAESTGNIQSLLESYVNSYREGTITYEQALSGINGLLTQLNKEMSAGANLQNIYDYLGTTNNDASNADAILAGIQQGLSNSATELLKSLEQYNKNSGMISEYTSSWQQLTNNVADMLEVLKQVRDNQKDSYDRDDDDDEPYDKSRGKGWGTGDVNNGPGVYADGIKNGLVGKSTDSEREKMLKHLATNNLKPGEVPILAHEGEAIFNDEQQNNLLRNLASAYSFKPIIPDYSKTLANVNMSSRSEPIVASIQYGDLSFPNVRNVDDAIGEFAKLTDQALRQVISKHKK